MEVGELPKLFLAITTAFLISYISIPVIIQIAGLKKLIDEPDNERKLHAGIIPTLGGIGIFSAFIISYSVWGDASDLSSYPFFVAGLFMLFLIGVKDDILVISPIKKLIVQLAASAEVVIGGKVYIENFHGLFGIHEIPWLISVLVSIFVFVTLINSYNLIDGIDGLAGGIGMIISAIFGIWFWGAGFHSLGILAFVLSGSLTGFLIFNIHPAKIFMGDTGSMAVGFILAFLSIQFIGLNESVVSTQWYISNAPVMAMAILIIPIIDTVRVFTLRIFSGQTPFKADHNHTHHKLLEMNISQHYASFSLWMANLVLIVMVYWLQELEPNILMIILVSAGFMILPSVQFTNNLAGHIRKKMDTVSTFSTGSFTKKES